MRRRSWLDAAARARFAKVVATIESKTSAEIVVTVRERASTYRHVDLAIGAVLGLAMLLVYVYAPIVFDDGHAVPAVVAAFVGGALLSSALDAPKRLFVPRAERQKLVATAARAAFVEQGISATRGRTGILVYVSLLENAVEVVPDIGVDVEALGPDWKTAVGKLAGLARASATPDAIADALLALREPLALLLPVREDDVNELPDGVVDGGDA